MTIQESTICNLVQTFPILLILAQNHNRCLKTPLIYKPPTPTPSPEYYEALDALFQSLFGHGYQGNDHSGCPYGHGTYVYNKKFSGYEYGHSSPCHTYAYPSAGHGYGHGYGHGSTGVSYGSHVIPSTTYYGYSGYPNFGFKKVSMYNASGTHGYKNTYAPTQVYSTNHKYKVVVKRNKNKAHRRKPQKLVNVFSGTSLEWSMPTSNIDTKPVSGKRNLKDDSTLSYSDIEENDSAESVHKYNLNKNIVDNTFWQPDLMLDIRIFEQIIHKLKSNTISSFEDSLKWFDTDNFDIVENLLDSSFSKVVSTLSTFNSDLNNKVSDLRTSTTLSPTLSDVDSDENVFVACELTGSCYGVPMSHLDSNGKSPKTAKLPLNNLESSHPVVQVQSKPKLNNKPNTSKLHAPIPEKNDLTQYDSKIFFPGFKPKSPTKFYPHKSKPEYKTTREQPNVQRDTPKTYMEGLIFFPTEKWSSTTRKPSFNQRENRRYPPSEYGFTQNFLSNAQEQLTSILHLRPHNRPNMAVYPINNRPIANDQYYYDQFGRPMYQPRYPPYPPQPYPGRPYEGYPRPNTIWSNNYDSNNFNGVNFPQDYNPITDPPDTINNPNIEGKEVNFPTERPIQSGVPTDTSSQPIESIMTNLPILSPVSSNDNQPIFTSRPIDTSELPPLEPVTSFDGPTFPAFKPEIPATSELPPFLPTMNTNSEQTPLKPIETNPGDPAIEPPNTPVSELNTGVPETKPETPATSELLPLSPAAELSPDASPFKPIPVWKPAIPGYEPEIPATSELPPLLPAPDTDTDSSFKPPPGGAYSTTEGKATESLPGFTLGGPSSDLPPLTPVPTLAPLTPVPASESRDSFNFSPATVFSEPCEVEGRRGSCVPLTSCDPYLAMLQQAKSNPAVAQFLRKVHCGFEGNSPKVCCPTPGIPSQPPPSPDTTSTTTTPEPVSTAPIIDESGEFIAELPQPPACGISNATFSRVVGGIPAKLGDFPWMALLGYKRNRGGTGWLCGGTLVSSKHILTAAHCIHGQEQKLYVVRLGELDLAREDEGATPIDILVKKMMKHEEYSGNSYVNDIGVLLLEREVQFTDMIRPICIPKQPELRANTFENYNPIIAGWGALEFRGPSASILQVLQLPVTGNAFCQQAYKAYAANVIDDRVICAGYKKGGKDACQGDSGGPLMQPIWNSEELTIYFYQIGVVSYGKKCAEPGFPGVYTRITTFVPWLEEKITGRRES